MRRFRLISLVPIFIIGGSILAGSMAFAAASNPLITLDENGHGTLQFPENDPDALTGFLAPDPGPGGLASALTYNLLEPPSLVAGDVFLLDPDSNAISDVIRFNPANPETGYAASLVFYSALDDGFSNLADTGFPGSNYANTMTFTELTGGISLSYTPTAGQPGFVDSFDTTYDIISDEAPEPASSALILISAAMLLAGRKWLKRTA